MRNPPVLPLRKAAEFPQLCGAKAANLSRLLIAGFRVPDGIVVTTEARPGTNSETLPPQVAEALQSALAAFGDTPLAVRSSGVAEDLPGASFAGQYETVLGARGFEQVSAAVLRCWASVSSPHLDSYRKSTNIAAAGLAILIQPLIHADAAGVAFSANPITGDRSETVVSAVRGLGNRLVSGEASPDEWLVRGFEAVCQTAPENAVTAAQVLAIAALARRVEARFAAPQDIEWALAGDDLYLLQARPITALPAAVPDPPPGSWQRADSHYPQPLYPFTRSVLLPAANRGFRRMCTEFGMLYETVEEREIGGWVYLRAVPLGGKDRTPPPDWLLRLLVRLAPSIRARVRQCAKAVREDKAACWIERWHAELKPALTARLAALRDTDLSALSDAGLDSHVQAACLLLRDSQEIHMLLNQSLNLLLAEFAFWCRDHLGWEEEKAFEMLAGLSDTSSAPARALARLSESKGAAGFEDAFAEYVREFGHRAIRYELIDPSLAETPELLYSLIDAQIQRAYDPEASAQSLADRRATLAAEARATLAARGEAIEREFARVLARAERAYPIREEHGFYDTSTPLALIRYAALELGRRLAARNLIANQTDVFFLEADEARTALATGAPQHELIELRNEERARALTHPGPARYGPQPPTPSFAALPIEARFVHEAAVWFADRVFAPHAGGRRQRRGATLNGTPASPGRYTGPARIIRSESEFSRIQPGDVLICPITSPVWSVLFPTLGAIVTDTGGFLSHSAIIAREYRIPAVVATGNATRLLRDGQLVTVDGTAGAVELKLYGMRILP